MWVKKILRNDYNISWCLWISKREVNSNNNLLCAMKYSDCKVIISPSVKCRINLFVLPLLQISCNVVGICSCMVWPNHSETRWFRANNGRFIFGATAKPAVCEFFQMLSRYFCTNKCLGFHFEILTLSRESQLKLNNLSRESQERERYWNRFGGALCYEISTTTKRPTLWFNMQFYA